MQTPLALSISCSIPCSTFFSKQVTTSQRDCSIFFQECFEIPLYVFVSVKIASTHERSF